MQAGIPLALGSCGGECKGNELELPGPSTPFKGCERLQAAGETCLPAGVEVTMHLAPFLLSAPFLLAFLWHGILLATLYLPWLSLPGAAGGQQPDLAAATNGGMLLGTADVAGMGF